MLRVAALALFALSLLVAPVASAEKAFRSADPVHADLAVPCDDPGDLTAHGDIGPMPMPGQAPCIHLCNAGGLLGITPTAAQVFALVVPAARVHYTLWSAAFASRAPLPFPDPPRPIA